MNYAQAVQVYLGFCERLDAKKPLMKQGGKRPGKKCGKGYIAAERKCKAEFHATETKRINEKGEEYTSRKLTEAGKASAKELAAKVRAQKGLSPLKSIAKKSDKAIKSEAFDKLPRTAQIKVKAIARAAKSAGYSIDIPNDGTVNGLTVSKPSSDGTSTFQRILVADRDGKVSIESWVSKQEPVNTGSNRRVKFKSVHDRKVGQFMGRSKFMPIAEAMASLRDIINEESTANKNAH